MRLFTRKPSPEKQLEKLLQAIEQPDWPTLSTIVDKQPELVNASNEFGMFPLLYAVFRRQPQVVSWLLAQGAAPQKRHRDGGSALNVAVIEGQTEIVKLLLEVGANPNQGDRFGAMPLMYASQPDVAHALIEAGADVNARDIEGDTVLMYAVNREDEAIIRLLLEAGAHLHARNFDNQTALDKARSPHIQQLLTD